MKSRTQIDKGTQKQAFGLGSAKPAELEVRSSFFLGTGKIRQGKSNHSKEDNKRLYPHETGT